MNSFSNSTYSDGTHLDSRSDLAYENNGAELDYQISGFSSTNSIKPEEKTTKVPQDLGSWFRTLEARKNRRRWVILSETYEVVESVVSPKDFSAEALSLKAPMIIFVADELIE
jgi:hypothetical protein